MNNSKTPSTHKEQLIAVSGSASGVASVLGSWQVCHALCLAVIAVLGAIGITITGMPFLFLTEIVVWMWVFAAVLLAIITYLYITKKCISKTLLVFNAGLITAGFPFFAQFRVAYWSIGAAIILYALYLAVANKKKKKECCT